MSTLLDPRQGWSALLKPRSRRHLERNFGGLNTGYRVRWEDGEPESGYGAEFIAHFHGQPNRVRVSRTADESPTEKCLTLVTELEHAKGDADCRALVQMARSRKIGRTEFVRRSVELEFQSMLRTRDYFRQCPLLQVRAEGRVGNINGDVELTDDFSEYANVFDGTPAESNLFVQTENTTIR